MEGQNYPDMEQNKQVIHHEMTQENDKIRFNEVPCYNVLCLLKRLVHKDDTLQWYYNEN